MGFLMFRNLLLTCRLIALFTLFILASGSVFAAKNSTHSMFQLTDAYYQSEGSMPVHLMDAPPEPQKVFLGDRLGVWFDIKIADGARSPCTERDEVACMWSVDINGNTNGNAAVFHLGGMNMRIDGALSLSTQGAPIPGKLDKGSATITFPILQGGVVLYSLSIPLDVN